MPEPTDPARDPGPVVDHWARERAVRGGRGGSSRRALVWGGCVLMLVIGVLGGAYTPYAWRQADAMQRAGTCPADRPSSREQPCFVEVPGRITGRFTKGEWRFTPDDPGLRVRYVRFSGDGYDESTWAPDLARVLSGASTTALYWDERPVAFDVDGRRVDTLSYGATTVMVGLWTSVMCLAFGTVALFRLRRRRADRLDLALVTAGTAALVCLGLDIFVDPPWPVEGVVFGVVVAVAALVPRRWVKAWSARVASRPL